jgi:hypothetical protein
MLLGDEVQSKMAFVAGVVGGGQAIGCCIVGTGQGRAKFFVATEANSERSGGCSGNKSRVGGRQLCGIETERGEGAAERLHGAETANAVA